MQHLIVRALDGRQETRPAAVNPPIGTGFFDVGRRVEAAASGRCQRRCVGIT